MRTELWYTDEHTRDVRFSMKVVEQIASTRPPTGACSSSTAAS